MLLLDEPTGALDPQSAALVEELIKYQLLSGRSAMLVSHDRGQIERLAHARLLLSKPAAAVHERHRRGCAMNATNTIALTPLDLDAGRAACSLINGRHLLGLRPTARDAASPSPPRAWWSSSRSSALVLKFIFAQTSPVVDARARARHGGSGRRRGGDAPAPPPQGLAGAWAVLGDAAVHRRCHHVARRRRHHRARALVCPALRAADPRHGARQHHDRDEPRAGHLLRDGHSASARRSRRGSRSARSATRP